MADPENLKHKGRGEEFFRPFSFLKRQKKDQTQLWLVWCSTRQPSMDSSDDVSGQTLEGVDDNQPLPVAAAPPISGTFTDVAPSGSWILVGVIKLWSLLCGGLYLLLMLLFKKHEDKKVQHQDDPRSHHQPDEKANLLEAKLPKANNSDDDDDRKERGMYETSEDSWRCQSRTRLAMKNLARGGSAEFYMLMQDGYKLLTSKTDLKENKEEEEEEKQEQDQLATTEESERLRQAEVERAGQGQVIEFDAVSMCSSEYQDTASDTQLAIAEKRGRSGSLFRRSKSEDLMSTQEFYLALSTGGNKMLHSLTTEKIEDNTTTKEKETTKEEEEALGKAKIKPQTRKVEEGKKKLRRSKEKQKEEGEVEGGFIESSKRIMSLTGGKLGQLRRRASSFVKKDGWEEAREETAEKDKESKGLANIRSSLGFSRNKHRPSWNSESLSDSNQQIATEGNSPPSSDYVGNSILDADSAIEGIEKEEHEEEKRKRREALKELTLNGVKKSLNGVMKPLKTANELMRWKVKGGLGSESGSDMGSDRDDDSDSDKESQEGTVGDSYSTYESSSPTTLSPVGSPTSDRFIYPSFNCGPSSVPCSHSTPNIATKQSPPQRVSPPFLRKSLTGFQSSPNLFQSPHTTEQTPPRKVDIRVSTPPKTPTRLFTSPLPIPSPTEQGSSSPYSGSPFHRYSPESGIISLRSHIFFCSYLQVFPSLSYLLFLRYNPNRIFSSFSLFSI